MKISVSSKGIHFDFEDDGPYVGIILNFFIQDSTEAGTEAFKRTYFSERPDAVWNRRSWNNYHFQVDAENLRYVIDQLYRAEIFNPEMRSKLEALIRKAEKYQDYKARLTNKISTAQKDILTSFIEPYLDGVFSAGFQQALKLIKLIQSYSDTEMDKLSGLPESLREDVAAIHKTFIGEANLESALIQSGSSLPNLEIQQKTMTKILYEKIIEKFAITDNEIKLVLHMALGDQRIKLLLLTYPDFNPHFIHEGGLKPFFNEIAGGYPGSLVRRITGSQAALGVSFSVARLKSSMTVDQLAACTKLIGEDDICGPHWGRCTDYPRMTIESPWLSVPLKRTDYDLDRCGPGYGF